ncbi:radical SAM family heme chaperone HemW [Candidatus Kapaibacterium sp.]
MINYGIYIHFPYCIHKCSYCDFYSIENLNSRNKFIRHLTNEISLRTDEFSSPVKADTLFIGGGTPSLMKPHHISQVFESLHKHFSFESDSEMTMECNPGTIDVKHFKAYKELGINRISFGVQSFLDKDLVFLERIHKPVDVSNAIQIARDTGFENISIDLMFALPGQTIEDWKYNLESAISLETEHISAYSLIYEPGTPLYENYISGQVKIIEEDLDFELYSSTHKLLTGAGFEQYEISNYAKNKKYCRHNLKYWSSEEYFGFGPSAHGYLNGSRYWNYRNNDTYFKLLTDNSLPTEGKETLTLEQKAFEAIYLGLRAQGLDLTKFQNDYGIELANNISKKIKMMESDNLIRYFDNKVILTNKGYFVSDNITLEFARMLK